MPKITLRGAEPGQSKLGRCGGMGKALLPPVNRITGKFYMLSTFSLCINFPGSQAQIN